MTDEPPLEEQPEGKLIIRLMSELTTQVRRVADGIDQLDSRLVQLREQLQMAREERHQ